jgi:ABC-type antimicrobial peptide transport system permease subunit
MGIGLIQGRFFNEQDIPSAPVAAIVNEAFVHQIVVTGSPLGLRVKDEDNGPHKYATIVGVMADARQGMNDRVAPEMIFNLNQILPTDGFYFLLNYHLDLVVRSRNDPATLISAITRIVHGLNPDVGVNQVETMQTAVDDTMGSQTLAARMLSLFALAALVIAAAGLYGLLAYQVTQQVRDFGVRLALGAQRKDLLWMVLRRAFVLLAIGGALGIAVSLAVSRVAASMLTGVNLHNILLVIEAVAAILAITCITASYLPARRAAQTNPIEALRHE